MSKRICVSKKWVVYIVTSLLFVGVLVFIYGTLTASQTISFTPRASEKSSKNKLVNKFLSSRRKITAPLASTTSCGGENEPICLTKDSFYCDNPQLGAYTKPVNKTFNQDCLIDFVMDTVENWESETNPNMTFEEKIDATVDIFYNNRYPQYQPYSTIISKKIQTYDGPLEISVVGLDPGQICKYHPYYLSELPTVCPGSSHVTCGGPGEPCCSYSNDYYRNLASCDKSYYLVCDDHAARKVDKYMVDVRELNGKRVDGILVGSICKDPRL